MDWRGRLETRAAWWTLLGGVPAFALSALAVPLLVGFALIRLLHWRTDRDLLTTLWALSGALVMLRATLLSIEALGQLWWRRLLHVLALWAVVAAVYPGWWVARG